MQPGTNLRQLRQGANLTLDNVVAALNRGLSKEQSTQKITSKQIRNWEAAKGLPVLTPSQTKHLLEIYNLTDLKELSLAMQSTQKQAGKPEESTAVAEEPATVSEEPAEASEESTETSEESTEETEESTEAPQEPATESEESAKEPED